jgi:hypothetical protein
MRFSDASSLGNWTLSVEYWTFPLWNFPIWVSGPMIRLWVVLIAVIAGVSVAARASLAAAILAGGETAVPEDAPSRRLDAGGEFPFVGALD